MSVREEIAGYFADGATFVPLGAVADPALVLQDIAQATDVQESGNRPLRKGLQAPLHSRSVLLVLDTFEHLLTAVPVAGR